MSAETEEETPKVGFMAMAWVVVDSPPAMVDVPLLVLSLPESAD